MPRFLSRLFALALLLGLLVIPWAAPGSAAATTFAQDAATPCPTMTEEDAAAWAVAWATAWNSHDPANVVALYSPSAVHHWGIGADTEGAEALTTALTNFFTAFPGIHLTVDRVWLSGDTVIIRWIAIGVQETDYMGVPASQTTVTWTGINVMQTACGLITEAWSEADHFGRIEQQGVISVAPEATPAT